MVCPTDLTQGESDLIHLAVGLLLFLLGLLAVAPPPTYRLWQLSVLVKGWGHWLAVLGLPLLWLGGGEGVAGLFGALLGAAGSTLLLQPLLRALPVARRLPAEMASAFGGEQGPLLPLSQLLIGPRARPIRPITITYRETAGQLLQMDLYQPPAGQAPGPILLVVHGGSWESGDRLEFPDLNRHLASRGCLVAAIDYRLAPADRFPAAQEDARAALEYLKAHGAEHGGDPGRIVVLGRSAGAQIAVNLAYTAGDPAVRGAISLYGPFDLTWGYSLPGWILDSKAILSGYLGGPPDAVPAAYAAASPIQNAGPTAPPTLMIQGEADVLVSPLHNVKLSARLAELGRPHLVVAVPLATHGSDYLWHSPFGRISAYAVEEFLRRVTGRAD